MNFGKTILLGAALILSLTTFAQKLDNKCDSLLFAANELLMNNNYKAATTHFIKAESICHELHEVQWGRLLASAISALYEEALEDDTKERYIDTILMAFKGQEAAGFYDEKSDFSHATYIMQSAEPDAKAADFYFQRGIKSQGIKTHESYIIYAFYATYLLFADAEGVEKTALKTRMISDYLWYSELINSADMTPQTQGTLDTYFEYVVESCDDLRPTVQGFIDSLPEEKTVAINRIQGMIGLFEDKHCENSIEYQALVDQWLKLDTSSIQAKYAQARILYKNDPTKLLEDIFNRTNDPELKAKCQYEIAYAQMNAGQYQAAYASGLSCTGKYHSDGLLIAAKCVAALANSCGDSTFERKCNYIYAAQLAEEAGQTKIAESYRASGPSSSDCRNDDRIPVILSCWGVTVYTCR